MLDVKLFIPACINHLKEIVATARQEDADAIGLSVLSGAHLTIFARIMELLESQPILVFGGGIISDGDIAKLKEMGVAQIFTPGASTTEIAEWLKVRWLITRI